MKLLQQLGCVLAMVVLVIIAGMTIQTWGPKTQSLVVAVITLTVVGLILGLLLLDRVTKDEDKR